MGKPLAVTLLGFSLALAFAAEAGASHAGSTRFASPNIGVVNDTGTWGKAITRSSRGWSTGTRVRMRVVAASDTNDTRCRFPVRDNRVRICQANYPDPPPPAFDWTAITDYERTRSGRYYRAARIVLDAPDVSENGWTKRDVICHELGHVLSLGHRGARRSCMYPGPEPSLTERPDAHDRRAVRTLYKGA